MGADCCGRDVKFEGLSADYKRRLWLVIAINATMFFVEMGAGTLAGSNALQADALDFLADSNLRHQPGGDRRFGARALICRHRQRREPERDGAVGAGDDRLPLAGHRRPAR